MHINKKELIPTRKNRRIKFLKPEKGTCNALNEYQKEDKRGLEYTHCRGKGISSKQAAPSTKALMEMDQARYLALLMTPSP
jgi:hypothetical protein